MTHTPGPWAVFDSGYEQTRPGIDAAVCAIVVYGTQSDSEGVHGRTIEERTANALLIAAAPEMLEALKRITEAVQHGDLHRFSVLFDGARAAIAKAEGLK